jgi:hypothetical protein
LAKGTFFVLRITEPFQGSNRVVGGASAFGIGVATALELSKRACTQKRTHAGLAGGLPNKTEDHSLSFRHWARTARVTPRSPGAIFARFCDALDRSRRAQTAKTEIISTDEQLRCFSEYWRHRWARRPSRRHTMRTKLNELRDQPYVWPAFEFRDQQRA